MSPSPPRRPPYRRARSRRPEITEVDRVVLAFLAEHRVAVVPQIQWLLGVSGSTAQARLRALESNGYIERRFIFAGEPGCCRILRDGLGAIDSSLRTPRIDLAAYQHDIGLGWLWLAAKAGTFGTLEELHSERAMRSHDARRAREESAIGVGLGAGGRDGTRQLHYPDMLLRTEGRLVAIELELSPKARGRLNRIMLGYAADHRIDAVLYLVRDRALGRRVEQAARRIGISDMVHVQLVAGAPYGASDDRGRTRVHRRQAPERGAQR